MTEYVKLTCICPGPCVIPGHKMMKVALVYLDDWAGIYVDGILKAEGQGVRRCFRNMN